jgi:uncharacterized protein with FMN-binding domain
MSGKGPDKKVANKFVLLGSTAVLAVYSAGYVRTQKAAELVAEKAARSSEARQRRLARVHVPKAPVAAASRVVLPGVLPDAVPEARPEAVPKNATAGSSQSALPAESAEHGPQGKAANEVKTANGVKAPNDAKAKATADAQAAAEAWRLQVEEVDKLDRATAAAAAAAPPVSPKTPAVLVTAKENPLSKWRDGTYRGYGTSFHGDIQVEVIIEGGDIVLASIYKCQTRYPCDIIEHLVTQVIDRQSAEVDNVTRATESADAFSTAIGNALKQAEKVKK